MLVTVAFHSAQVLGELLATVADASSAPMHVVVADNSPTDPSAAAAAHEFGARYVPIPENPGYGAAVNRAVAESPGGEWILVCNPDLRLGIGSVDELVQRSSDPRVGMAGPLILEPNGQVYPSARSIPSLRTGIGHALISPFWIENPWTHRYRQDQMEPMERETGWLSGACLLIRRSVFERVGGFDESYFMYFEDVDLGYRVGRLGLVNLYVPSAVVTHIGAHSTRSSSEMIKAHHRSAERFLERKYSAPWMWTIRLPLRIGLRLRSAFLSRSTS